MTPAGSPPAATPSAAALWVRDAALLAAELTLRAPADAPLSPREGWPGAADRWTELRSRARGLDLTPTLLVEAAAQAVELFPEAAAAFSLLAESPALMLPTPAALARIAVAGLGWAYDTALAGALSPSPLIERAAPTGQTVPAALSGLRLSDSGLARLTGHAASALGDHLPARHSPIHARAARAAALILAEDGAVWLRSRSRRMARQLALDLATGHPARAALVLTARAGEPLPPLEATGALLVLDLFDLDHAPRLPPLPPGLCVLAPDRFDHPGLRAIDAPPLTGPAAAAVWQAAGLDGDGDLARRFRLTLPELLAARTEAETLMALRQSPNGVPTPPPDEAALEHAIRAAGARRMGPFVTTVETGVTLDDLVCTPGMRSALEDAVAWRRTDRTVWETMALPRDAGEAQGLSLLFSGPPGGGKTFAARCFGQALGLNLYRVDLSQVVSKYIGETEKRLANIFDEAEAGHGVLFFDEADAIFGKRSEVKDAHDRYANIEVGYLLQRLESFGGVVVLATNLRANLDAAFTRRMQFIIDFPMPGRAERALLWQRNLPAQDWCAPDLDVAALADRFRLSGGNIRNAAVAAAHLAAADRAPLGPRHLARALVRELEKSGLPRGAADLGSLAEHLEGGA